MNEVQAILVSGGTIVMITAVGWGATILRNNRLKGRDNGISAERLDNMEGLFNSLPCRDSKYMIEWGKLLQGFEDMQLRITKLEQVINQSLADMQKRMENLESAIRLRKIPS